MWVCLAKLTQWRERRSVRVYKGLTPTVGASESGSVSILILVALVRMFLSLARLVSPCRSFWFVWNYYLLECFVLANTEVLRSSSNSSCVQCKSLSTPCSPQSLSCYLQQSTSTQAWKVLGVPLWQDFAPRYLRFTSLSSLVLILRPFVFCLPIFSLIFADNTSFTQDFTLYKVYSFLDQMIVLHTVCKGEGGCPPNLPICLTTKKVWFTIYVPRYI